MRIVSVDWMREIDEGGRKQGRALLVVVLV